MGQVDDVSADYIISQLLFLDAEDQEKDIKLFINSPGGSVTAGMYKALYSRCVCVCLIFLFRCCYDKHCYYLQSNLSKNMDS